MLATNDARTIEVDLERLREYLDAVAKSGRQRLPPEPRLSEELDVSRGRLRTILRRAEEVGLIWRHVGKGTFIGQREVQLGETRWLSQVSPDDIIEARIMLEPLLASRAAIHANQADLETLQNCLAEMDQAGEFATWKRLDEKLHRLIAQATHNPLLLILYDTMRSQVKLRIDSRLEAIYAQDHSPKQATDHEHRRVIDAIVAHDPRAAEQAMRTHLVSLRERLFG